MNLLQLFWKYIVYYNFWRLILHHITLQIYCLIELIRIFGYLLICQLTPLFPLQFQIVKNSKCWEFWCCVASRKRSLVILGLDGFLIVLFIGQLTLCTWDLDFVLIKLLEIYFIKKLLRYFGFIWFNFWG